MRISEKRLQAWVDAGLISVDQIRAIQEFEAKNSPPRANWVIWGITAIGIAAIAIGIISIVAANWDRIPPNFKLMNYLFWQSVAGFALYKFLPKPGFIREALIGVFTLLFFAGIGLTAQVFNIKSDGWSGLLMWCGLALPMVLYAQTRPINYIWMIVLFIAEAIFLTVHVERMSDELRQANWILAGCLSAYVYYGIGMFRRRGVGIPTYLGEASSTISFLSIFIIGTAIGTVMWYADIPQEVKHEAPGIVLRAKILPWLGAAIVSLALWCRTPSLPSRLTIALCAAFFALAAFCTTPLFLATDGQKVIGTIFSIGVWWILAMAAVYAGHKWLFDTITLLITIRVLVVYFEVFGSMLATGIGLIISGILILGVAWVWYKFRGQLAGWLEDR